MFKRAVVVLLSVGAAAAAFVLPANAAAKESHLARAYGVRGLVRTAPKGAVAKPQQVNLAWVAAAQMPVAVEETGGAAGAGAVFYVAGGYKTLNCGTGTCLNDTVQTYKKTTNIWTNDTVNPIPTVPGLQPGIADVASCYDPVGKKVHILDGVAYDSTGAGFIIRQHLVYDPAAPNGTRWTFLSGPVDSAGNSWFGQDQGCAFIGGMMYLFSGYGIVSPLQPQAIIERLTWVYDPNTDTWSDTGKLLATGRLWMGYASNTTNAFVAGGTNNLTTLQSLGTTEKFTPSTGWAAGPSLPGGATRLAPGEGVAGRHLMIWGGGSGNVNSGFTVSNSTFHCTLPACGAIGMTNFNLPSAKWFSAFGNGSVFYNAGGDTGGGVPVKTAEHLP